MRKIILALAVSVSITSIAQKAAHCDPAKEAGYESLSKPNKVGGYGEVINTKNAVTLQALETKMKLRGSAEVSGVKVMGKVVSVCKKKGCWVAIDKGNGETVRVRFKDYAFFVPRNCEGQIMYAQGTARFDTTSVAMLQHYASDAGKSKEEIDAIKDPEIELVFEAEGVLFNKK